MKTKDYAEIIGIGAVVVSLLMLTYELRQNTVASQQAAAATYSEAWRDIELFSAGNPEFTSTLLKAINGEREQLTAGEISSWTFFIEPYSVAGRTPTFSIGQGVFRRRFGTLNSDS